MNAKYDLSFFENIIKDFEKDQSIVIDKVNEKQPAVAKGHNFLSDVWRLQFLGKRKVENDLKECNFRLIVKMLPQDENYLKIFPCTLAFENELKSYTKIIPTLNKYAAHKINVPDCIFASVDMIVLEDLRCSGFENVDKIHGFTDDRIKQVLEELANIHSASVLLKLFEPEVYEEYTKNAHDFAMYPESAMSHYHIESLEMALLIAKEKNADQKIIDILENLVPQLFQKECELFNLSEPFKVINHGDAWANNILFDKQNNIKLVDLQNMRCSLPAADLCYFLYAHLSTEHRKTHFNNLLQIYLTAFNSNIKNKTNSDKLTLNMHALQKQMKDFSLYGFASALLLAPVFFLKNDELMNAENFEKVYNASVEQKVKKCDPELKNRMFQLVQSFIEDIDLKF